MGKIEISPLIARLKYILEFETLYWTQLVEKEKAIARIEAISGVGP
ncbi:MAG: hypothetical protein RMJ39_08305 [Deltaproteobacteria bacterium]|nr:hypothetical protein [Deltaproteobacteria bacterium]